MAKRQSRLAEERFSLVDPAEVIPRNPRKWKNIAKSSRDLADELYSLRRNAMRESSKKKTPAHTKTFGTFINSKIDAQSGDLLSGKTSIGKIFKNDEYAQEFAKANDVSIEDVYSARDHYKKYMFQGIDRRKLAVKDMTQRADTLNLTRIDAVRNKKGGYDLEGMPDLSKDKYAKRILGGDYDDQGRLISYRVLNNKIDFENANALKGERSITVEKMNRIIDTAFKSGRITSKQKASLELKVGKANLANIKQQNDFNRALDTFNLDSQANPFGSEAGARQGSLRTFEETKQRLDSKLLNGTYGPSVLAFQYTTLNERSTGRLNVVTQQELKRMKSYQELSVTSIFGDLGSSKKALASKVLNISDAYGPYARRLSENVVGQHIRRADAKYKPIDYPTAVNEAVGRIRANDEISPIPTHASHYEALSRLSEDPKFKKYLTPVELSNAILDPRDAVKFRNRLYTNLPEISQLAATDNDWAVLIHHAHKVGLLEKLPPEKVQKKSSFGRNFIGGLMNWAFGSGEKEKQP